MWIEVLKYLAVIIGAYFIGNINIALIISKIKKRDIRVMGSGNPGTMNMLRNFGVKMGALTLTLDAVKGTVPCLLGWLVLGNFLKLDGEKIGLYVAAVSVIIGHIFPVVLKFRGGKGIASSIGVCLVLNPLFTLIMFAVGVVFIFATKMGSITSFLIISFPIAYEGIRVQATGGNLAELILIFFLFFLTLFAHRKNVIKLFSGTESKTVIIKKKANKI